MPKYSNKSAGLLAKVHEDLQTIFNEVIKSRDCTILDSTVRTKEQQAEFVRTGASKTMDSKHLPQTDGKIYAVDAENYPVNFSDEKSQAHFAGFVLGVAARLYAEGKISHKVRWGGDWNQNGKVTDGAPGDTFSDPQHFELI